MGQRFSRSSRVLGCTIRIKIPKGARVGLPMLVHPDQIGMSNIWGKPMDKSGEIRWNTTNWHLAISWKASKYLFNCVEHNGFDNIAYKHLSTVFVFLNPLVGIEFVHRAIPACLCVRPRSEVWNFKESSKVLASVLYIRYITLAFGTLSVPVVVVLSSPHFCLHACVPTPGTLEIPAPFLEPDSLVDFWISLLFDL